MEEKGEEKRKVGRKGGNGEEYAYLALSLLTLLSMTLESALDSPLKCELLTLTIKV